jgi:hypothetical protein
LAIVLLFATMRYGLLDVPLERGEGEYAWRIRLWNSGVEPGCIGGPKTQGISATGH